MKRAIQVSRPNEHRGREIWTGFTGAPCHAVAGAGHRRSWGNPMGDKGGKKDKEKSQKQKTEKKVEQGKAKQDKQTKK
jgi:hypothetical protein